MSASLNSRLGDARTDRDALNLKKHNVVGTETIAKAEQDGLRLARSMPPATVIALEKETKE